MDDRFIHNYSEVARQKKTTLKSVLRNVALTGLSAVSSSSYLKVPRVQFLYIHHLFRDEEKQLNKLLKLLAEDHQFISYSEAVERVLSGNIDKPYITFSSDDGFKNNLKAAEILDRYNAKACFFVNPGIVGATDYDVINKFCTETLRFPPVEFLTWHEIHKLQVAGHEIGSHTMMHINIAETPVQAITEDMHQTFKILTERCGSVAHFAFPFGRFFHFSAEGRKATFEAGFTTCATAERGCHIASPGPIAREDLCIRRDHTVLGWDINHIMYFLINNAKNANISNNLFPDSLR
jgi:peptidoglycan/xylan/chitin deacetylase (PgdA/CDA1 family)